MEPPWDVSGLRRLLGMPNHVGCSLPHLSTISAPIRVLLQKNKSWIWDHAQQDVLDKHKETLSSEICMAKYNPLRRRFLLMPVRLVFGLFYLKITNRGSTVLLPMTRVHSILQRIGTAKRRKKHWLCLGQTRGPTSSYAAFSLTSRLAIVHC